jgi:hypothetical protein
LRPNQQVGDEAIARDATEPGREQLGLVVTALLLAITMDRDGDHAVALVRAVLLLPAFSQFDPEPPAQFRGFVVFQTLQGLSQDTLVGPQDKNRQPL